MLRRWLGSAMLAILVVLVPGVAVADYGVDCDDFASSEAAQAYYESQGGIYGGDPDGLDRDQDGQACDWGAPPPDIDWDGDTHPADSNEADRAPGSHDRDSVDRLPWWAWAGGGVAALWIIGLARVST